MSKAIRVRQEARDRSLDPLRACSKTPCYALLVVMNRSGGLRANFARDRAVAALLRVAEVTKDMCYDCDDDIYSNCRAMSVMRADYAQTIKALDAMLLALADMWWVRTCRYPEFASPCTPDGTRCASAAKFWATEHPRVQAAIKSLDSTRHRVLCGMYTDYVLAFASLLQDVGVLPRQSTAVLGKGRAMYTCRRTSCWPTMAYDYADLLLLADADTASLSSYSLVILRSTTAQKGLVAMRRLFHALAVKQSHSTRRELLLTAWEMLRGLWRRRQNMVVAAATSSRDMPHALAAFSGQGCWGVLNDRRKRTSALAAFASQQNVCWAPGSPFLMHPCPR
jgi:hypothetical protein